MPYLLREGRFPLFPNSGESISLSRHSMATQESIWLLTSVLLSSVRTLRTLRESIRLNVTYYLTHKRTSELKLRNVRQIV